MSDKGMGEMIKLRAEDGHEFGAYRAAPKGTARGAIVVIMEIFGVNQHIRGLCDSFAADGYVGIAPQIYDRIERDVDLGYGPDDFPKGRDLRSKMTWDHCLADVAATVKVAGQSGRVGITGYCYGGGVAYAAACRVPGLSASVGYYGGGWKEFLGEAPKCPTMLQFALQDAMIPASLAGEFKAKHPSVAVHMYDADHGFVCEARPHYDPYATTLARHRQMGFYAATLD